MGEKANSIHYAVELNTTSALDNYATEAGDNEINLINDPWIKPPRSQPTYEGMGELRIVAGGIQLSGQAMVLDALLASTIRSRKGQHISIESSRNFTVNARDEGGRVVNRIFLGNDQLECLAREFKVTDARGTVLFSASKHEVVVGAKVLRVTGEGGAIFDGTVQTPIVRADSGHELRLESPTRSLKVRAPLGVLIESRAGDISASCLTDLKLQSLAGAGCWESSRCPTESRLESSPRFYTIATKMAATVKQGKVPLGLAEKREDNPDLLTESNSLLL
uniref:Zeta-sarcoglycan n=1 Tax=Timema douglasi TaxID=61478 RepID=A0A7R8Z614_TIMDO|nr:unnamed protein product [Timema douglasi]